MDGGLLGRRDDGDEVPEQDGTRLCAVVDAGQGERRGQRRAEQAGGLVGAGEGRAEEHVVR
jgi:hypothetical protein